MTKKIKWRLGDLPTPDELRGLVGDGLLTKEEAREILFSEEENTKRDEKSLEAEIKFLRELVERLSKNQQTVITTIREIERPYVRYPWYQPYQVWCSTSNVTNSASSINLLSSGSTAINALGTIQNNASFSAIKTF